MTEVKPPSMQDLQSSKLSPWSRCRAMGSPVSIDCRLDKLHQIGVVGVCARALGHLQDDRSFVLMRAASVMPCTISMLLTLNAPTA